jgi:hypothetical protein
MMSPLAARFAEIDHNTDRVALEQLRQLLRELDRLAYLAYRISAAVPALEVNAASLVWRLSVMRQQVNLAQAALPLDLVKP